MTSLRPTTLALLKASRHAREPTDEQLARVGHSLMAKLAAAGGAAAAIQTGASTAAAASAPVLAAKSVALKLLLSATVVGLGAFGTFAWVASRPDSGPQNQSAATLVLETSAPGVGLAPPKPAPADKPNDDDLARPEPPLADSAAPQRAKPTSSRSSQQATPAVRLQEEARLLSEVHGALGAGRGAQALERLREYDARFAGGVLSAEADAARVFALCQTGRRADAEAAASRFLRRYPGSPFAARVGRGCAAGESPRHAR